MKKILLLGSGELGKEFVIAAQRLGQHFSGVIDGPLNLVIVFAANLHFQVYGSAVFQLAVYVKAEKASISPFSP